MTENSEIRNLIDEVAAEKRIRLSEAAVDRIEQKTEGWLYAAHIKPGNHLVEYYYLTRCKMVPANEIVKNTISVVIAELQNKEFCVQDDIWKRASEVIDTEKYEVLDIFGNEIIRKRKVEIPQLSCSVTSTTGAEGVND